MTDDANRNLFVVRLTRHGVVATLVRDRGAAGMVPARAEKAEGEKAELEATGLLARALQQEVDHLHGILFIDRMSPVTKVALRSRLKRLKKENEL